MKKWTSKPKETIFSLVSFFYAAEIKVVDDLDSRWFKIDCKYHMVEIGQQKI